MKSPLSPTVLYRVRQLRQNATDAERLLWQLLRDRQFLGLKFRRQHPLGGYILDFHCHKSLLGIELDGGQHAEPEEEAYDAARKKGLEELGVRVLRFWNNEALGNPQGVLEVIAEAVAGEEEVALGVGSKRLYRRYVLV
jgi:very-short-patch-repair endonuclease